MGSSSRTSLLNYMYLSSSIISFVSLAIMRDPDNYPNERIANLWYVRDDPAHVSNTHVLNDTAHEPTTIHVVEGVPNIWLRWADPQ
jgi:hypothetical protein